LKAIYMDDMTVLKLLIIRFQRHPLLSAAKFGIAIEDGVAVLSGFAVNGASKAIAELVAFETPGVRAVANEIETSEDETWRYVDCKVAKKACDLLDWNALTPKNLRVRVERGRLSVFGEVESQGSCDAVTSILREFSGAKSVETHLKVAAPTSDRHRQDFTAVNLCA
jgi:osmotically-inducible protein OsmY